MKALEGIRVLDLSRFGAGPYCTWILARLGAEVIRVEAPRGDFDRFIFVRTPTGENTLFLTFVSGKKSVTLDLGKGGRAKDLFAELVRKSDVVVESLGPKVPELWGVTYEDLCAIKPDIILVHTTAYGTTGPFKDRVGFDSTGQAMSGAMSLAGVADTPMKGSVPYIDFGTGAHAAIGVLTALLNRSATGKGQRIDVSLLRTGVAFASYQLSEYPATGVLRDPRRIGNRTYWISFGDLCQTRDNKLVYVGIVGPMMHKVFRKLGRDDLLNDPRFVDDHSCFVNRDVLDPIIKEWISSMTMTELDEIAHELRISATPCLDYTEVASHPQIKAEKMLVKSSFTDGSFSIDVPACPVRFSDGDIFTDDGAIPTLGEHNREVWMDLCGLDGREFTDLQGEGIL